MPIKLYLCSGVKVAETKCEETFRGTYEKGLGTCITKPIRYYGNDPFHPGKWQAQQGVCSPKVKLIEWRGQAGFHSTQDTLNKHNLQVVQM